ncbi:MAG: hypothetical protein BWY69_00741 [Planctomycetes bacterium ADurb.Bin401]|nr:MAG: hypothetical protein BWY69_00741 [Planctomycetes bacterium ADurb.Bin401]
MKQYEAVIKVMEENGGLATLGHLYQNVLKVRDVEWQTKTPFASMRRIVQTRPEIFKIKPGLWALKEYKDKLPKELKPQASQVEKDTYSHTYYQGLLLEIGKLNKCHTFVPNQDKNKMFLGKTKLGEIASLNKIFEFSYADVISFARTIDVIWFNERQMPNSIFEIEHSTNIKNSLLKFVELQDFRTKMFIVADDARKGEFTKNIDMSAFKCIHKYVEFLSYDELSEMHSQAFVKAKFN